MKSYKWEIGILSIAIIAILIAVSAFLDEVQEKQKALQIDLYAFAGEDTHTLLTINRPHEFSRSILSQTECRRLFSRYIPEIFLSIASENALPAPLLIAFQSHREAILYLRADKKQAESILRNTLKKRFGPYEPLSQNKNGTTFYFLPDSGNRFFGYFRQEGIWVASYSRKLLEKASERLRKEQAEQSENRKPSQEKKGKALLSLDIQAETLRLSVWSGDSTLHSIENCRVTADLFTENDRLCYFGQIPYSAALDTLYPLLGDTLAMRIEHFFPDIRIANQTTIEEKEVYFSGCIVKD